MSERQEYYYKILVDEASYGDVKESHTRLFLMIIVFVMVFMLLSARVFEVSVINQKENHANSNINENNNHIGISKSRSDIIDRNGVLLAVNLETASLYANPRILMDLEDAAKKITTLFPELNYEATYKKLSSSSSFVWIKRNLTPDEQYQINSLGIPGLYFKEEEKRIYPHKNLLAHVLGNVDVDGNGVSGIEKQFNTYLSGKDYLGVINSPMQLSVDVRVQNIVHNALKEAMDEFKALGASGIVMDVNSGEVISMVSLPDFDLNTPSNAENEARFNRSTYGKYEMGSTLKTFNMALGFEKSNLKMDDLYDISEPLKVGGFSIRDYHQKKTQLTADEAYVVSSNIASAKIALEAGEAEQKSFLMKLGLLDEVEIELPEVRVPSYPDNWGKASTMTISFGHGISVTPMHVVKATAALVNGGILYPTTLIKKDKYDFLNVGQRVVSEDTSNKIRKLMRWAVKYGTGSKSNIDGYLVGGKTGTASKLTKGRYNESLNISSFIASFPMNSPKYVVFVMLDEPVGNKKTAGYTTGGMIAAPVVKNIISRAAPILGVLPVDESDYEIRKEFWYKNVETDEELSFTESD